MALIKAKLSIIFLLLEYSSLAMSESYIAPSLITPAPAPAFNANVIEKRGAAQTCGYVGGDPICPGTASCTFTNYYWGCCNALTCDTPAACELDSVPYCGGVAFANCDYPQIRRCTKIGGTDLMTSWNCGATDATYFVLATTTGGVSTGGALTGGLLTGGVSTSSLSTSATQAATATTSVPGTGTISNETTSPSPTYTPNSLTPGAIAGITIGSIAGALIICAFIYYIFNNFTLIRRNQDDRQITGGGYTSGGMPKPISNSGFEMSDRMAGGSEFHDDRTWDGPAVDVRTNQAQNSTTYKKVKGAPDYDDAAYWDTKFITGQDVGEWLNEGDLLIDRAIADLEKQYSPTIDNQGVTKDDGISTPRTLHLGPGISAVGSKLCEAFERRGWKGCDIVNVDFSSEAVRLGRERETEKSNPDSIMHWIQADLCSWKDVSQRLLPLAPFDVLLDKSTSDAIATSVPRIFHRSSIAAEANDVICPALRSLLQDETTFKGRVDSLTLLPVELLALHLVPLTRKGAIWLVLSYSSTRCDGLPYLNMYWEVVSRTPLKAPSGQASSAAAMVPDVFHSLYTLRRK
uniref:Putative LRR receptor-like serine/threonine-protein kinase n=1 Tax=Talaromyces marneffei PM1 TaxID=1077442 RepID=A0A093XLB2_TALMA